MRRIERARALRKQQTDAEDLLWTRLRRHNLGYQFRRQVPMGRYFVDFACLKARLVVEVDGGQHLDDPGDEIRTSYLRSRGFRVLRFWNFEVLRNPDGVVEAIFDSLREGPLPNPPPR